MLDKSADNIYSGGEKRIKKRIKKMQKTSKKTRFALDKSTTLVYNTDMRNKENKMTNNNNNNKKVNTMSNLDKLINHFMLRGHSWLAAVKLAKSTLAIIENGNTVRLRAFVRVDEG